MIGWAQLDPPVMQGNDVLISGNTGFILPGTVVQQTSVIGDSQTIKYQFNLNPQSTSLLYICQYQLDLLGKSSYLQ